MGKFNMADDRSRLKELARKKNEKAAEREKEKATAVSSKRKETASNPTTKPSSNKKMKAIVSTAENELKGDRTGQHVAEIESSKDKGQGTTQEIEKNVRSNSGLVKLKPFIDDVT